MTDSELLSCFEIAPRQCSMVVGYADGMLRMWTFGLKAQQVRGAAGIGEEGYPKSSSGGMHQGGLRGEQMLVRRSR